MQQTYLTTPIYDTEATNHHTWHGYSWGRGWKMGKEAARRAYYTVNNTTLDVFLLWTAWWADYLAGFSSTSTQKCSHSTVGCVWYKLLWFLVVWMTFKWFLHLIKKSIKKQQHLFSSTETSCLKLLPKLSRFSEMTANMWPQMSQTASSWGVRQTQQTERLQSTFKQFKTQKETAQAHLCHVFPVSMLS